jgi:hypothetical protein
MCGSTLIETLEQQIRVQLVRTPVRQEAAGSSPVVPAIQLAKLFLDATSSGLLSGYRIMSGLPEIQD